MAKSQVVIEIETDTKGAFEFAAWALFRSNTERMGSGEGAIGYIIVNVTPEGTEGADHD